MPLTTFVVFSSFIVYATWALSRASHYHYGNYLSPFYSPELFGDSPPRVFGKSRWAWPIPFVCYSPALLILVSRSRSASPATTTAAPTTRRSGPTRRRAPSASRARATSASASFPLHHPEHPPLLPVPRAALHRLPRLRRRGRRSGSPTPDGQRHFGIGVGTLVLRAQRRPARRLHLRLPLVAPPGRRRARRALAARRVRKTPTTASSCLNRRHMRWAWISLFWRRRSPTSTSASARWASGPIWRIF